MSGWKCIRRGYLWRDDKAELSEGYMNNNYVQPKLSFQVVDAMIHKCGLDSSSIFLDIGAGLG